jgi:y4mF family transcriptional regulator
MRRSLEQLKSDVGEIAWSVREHRRQLGYTQAQLAARVGVGLRFLRELERGKPTLRMDRVEQVLAYFGLKLGVVPRPRGQREQARAFKALVASNSARLSLGRKPGVMSHAPVLRKPAKRRPQTRRSKRS